MAQRRRLPGKKAGDFTLTVHGQKHKVPYRVREEERENAFDETWFVDIEEPFVLKIEADTRPELRELLQTKMDEALGIEWRSVIRVRTLRADYTDPQNSSTGLPGRVLGLAHDFLEVGERPDGTPVWRFPRGRSDIRNGEPFQGDNDVSYANYGGKHPTERIEQHSIIPDTEENRRKLTELHEAMKLLSERFSEAFAPDRVAETLLASNPGRLLLGGGV